jgi:predicted transposase YbfD/YdcC
LERVLKRIDSEAFETAFLSWIKTLEITTEGKIISIDGKTVRGSQDDKNGNYAIHLVSAWCTSNSLMLGQIKTASKCNEIKAVQQLLDLIDVEGGIITIDAMGCQKDIAAKIKSRGADYILAVKQNQETLYNEIGGAFAHKKADDIFISKYENDHGRIEQRTCSVITRLSWIKEKDKWIGLSSIIKLEASREVDGGLQQKLVIIYPAWNRMQKNLMIISVSIGVSKIVCIGRLMFSSEKMSQENEKDNQRRTLLSSEESP